MKALKDMSLTELIDYWWGYLIIEIGKGKGKDAICLILMQTTKDAYDRGIKEGKK
uniref:Uncharacterized protein n=1 Tax=viral metagenome TaxID=1070528 RepID=A0A6H2A6G8_9ZZZZ